MLLENHDEMRLENHDKHVAREFQMLRLWLSITFIGLFLVWTVFVGWVVYRLGPGGYSAADAQADRTKICQMIEILHPKHGVICPDILGG